MKKGIKVIALAAMLVAGVVFAAWANVPAPPVNQQLGIPDGIFSGLTETQCRECHVAQGGTPPAGVPIDPIQISQGNVNRHHLLVGTAIPATSAVFSTTPTNPTNPDANQDGVNDTIYDCMNCHALTVVNGVFVIQSFRNCTLCHEVLLNQETVHHATAQARGRDCKSCHGSVVDNSPQAALNPGTHVVPTYNPGLVTPFPSNKPNGGALNPNPALLVQKRQGNCDYCHFTLGATEQVPDPNNPGQTVTIFPPATDTVTGRMVYRNAETHHSTGLVLNDANGASRCFWCHQVTAPGVPNLSSPLAIRKCQECHSIGTLHNIQVDSPAPANVGTIVPGAEQPWWGHIGNNADCQGCHGFTATASAAPGAGPLAMDLDGLSSLVFTAGEAKNVVAWGTNFVNSVSMYGMTLSYAADVVVTDANGYARTLQPLSRTASSMEFTMPADLGPGTYKVTMQKNDKTSNPTAITVMPNTRIASASCDNGTLTVLGSGFGSAPPAAASDLGAFMNGAQAQVVSWADDKIVASGVCGENLVLKSTYTANGAVAVTAPPVIEPPTPPADPPVEEEEAPVIEEEAPVVIAPVIEDINRSSGRAGYTRKLEGTNFQDKKGDSYVQFGDMKAEIRSWSEDEIAFRVPRTKRGNYDVSVVVNGVESNKVSFRVR